MGTIAAMQNAALAIEAKKPGYDQYQRWGFTNDRLHPSLESLVEKGEADCSSLSGAIAYMGGWDGLDLSDPFYTRTFKPRLLAVGFTAIPFVSLDQIRAGDFLLRESSHVVFVYLSGTFYSARIDENGHAHGGFPGDQTGKEVCFQPAYYYPGGWDWIIRPPAGSGGPIATPVVVTPSTSSDPNKLVVDGDLGYNSIGKLQQLRGTPVDHVISHPKSTLVFSIQAFLRTRRYVGLNGRALDYDGSGFDSNSTQNVGPYQTTFALQHHLHDIGYFDGTFDGKLDMGDSLTVRGIQEAANAGKLFT